MMRRAKRGTYAFYAGHSVNEDVFILMGCLDIVSCLCRRWPTDNLLATEQRHKGDERNR